VLGRKLRLVVYDDHSEPATAVRLYQKLITEDKVNLVLGPYGSPVTDAVADVTEKYKMPMPAHAATASIFKKGRKFIFMVLSPAELFLEGLVDLAARRGLKTIALINEDTIATRAIVRGAIELAKRKGFEVVFEEAYPKGHTDFAPILMKVRAANPDILAAGTYFDDAVALTRQLRRLDVNPKMYAVTVGRTCPGSTRSWGKTPSSSTAPHCGIPNWSPSGPAGWFPSAASTRGLGSSWKPIGRSSRAPISPTRRPRGTPSARFSRKASSGLARSTARRSGKRS
jgi:branched-chain amino acid transport system substrate-binding protein